MTTRTVDEMGVESTGYDTVLAEMPSRNLSHQREWSTGALALEALVDCTSVRAVLECLAECCEAKSSHLATNWQDEDAAKLWAEVGCMVHELSCGVQV